MTEPMLLRVNAPRAFLLADLQGFVLKALATSPIIPDAHAAMIELVEYIDHPILGLFLVREGSDFVGLALVEANHSALYPGCIVLHFYNQGSAAARKLLIQAVLDFARTHKFTKIRGVDINQKPAAFARLFRDAGPAKPVGEFFEFQMPEG